MKLAMTIMAVTASICANASEADLFVASFMPFSLDLGISHRCLAKAQWLRYLNSEHPSTIFALMTPQSANIDNAKID
jgi:hypothetical protein